VFRRTGEKSTLIKKTEEPKTSARQAGQAFETAGSRLKKLAYVLDQRAEEEQRLAQEGPLRSTNQYEVKK
jgi:hypothetical protein